MTIICNVTGSERKRLADALGAILLWEPVYTKAPSFAYVVNNYTVDKSGTIICPDSATQEEVEQIAAKLAAEGFTTEIADEAPVEDAPAEMPAETPDVAPEPEAATQSHGEAEEAADGQETPDVAEEPAMEDAPAEKIPDEAEAGDDSEAVASDEDGTKLSISVPRANLPDDALERLRILVKNKEELFKRALQTDALPIEASEEEISFPWFTLTGIDGEAAAYTQFIAHLCNMAKEQSRILDRPYDGDNDKFAMRIFMVRLGMKGAEFALARKLMMKHLTGNSGWRYGAPPKKEPDTPAEDENQAAAEIPLPEEAPDTTKED